MDKELSIIVTMIKETEKRIQEIYKFKASYFEEEKKLYSKLEYLNNLLNKININKLSDTINI